MKTSFTFRFVLIGLLLIATIKGFSTHINVWGTINSITTWNYDTVRVYGNVTVNNGVKLTISAGAKVIFMGHYSLKIQGQLYAKGNKTYKIIFKAYNPSTGWAGIRFDNTPTSNAQSIIEYCIIQNGKANSGTTEEKMGGAIFVKGTSDLIIRNNILSNNRASMFGGAITCRYGAAPTIANNIICNNSSSSNGGGIYLFQANPRIANNTIANNTASSGGGVYANQSAPYIYSNIIYGNQASSNTQLNTGLTKVRYNIIQGGYSGYNYNTDPKFVTPSSGAGTSYNGVTANWSLKATSLLLIEVILVLLQHKVFSMFLISMYMVISDLIRSEWMLVLLSIFLPM